MARRFYRRAGVASLLLTALTVYIVGVVPRLFGGDALGAFRVLDRSPREQ
jgi:hypothetical protein